MRTLGSLELENQGDHGIIGTIALYHLTIELEEDHIFCNAL